jgi:hypothetical protein
MSDAALAETWRKYRGWAARARAIRNELDRGHLWALLLTVAGAAIATLSARWGVWWPGAESEPVVRLLSAVSAVALAVAAWLSKSVLDPTRERQWVRARSLAGSEV